MKKTFKNICEFTFYYSINWTSEDYVTISIIYFIKSISAIEMVFIYTKINNYYRNGDSINERCTNQTS